MKTNKKKHEVRLYIIYWALIIMMALITLNFIFQLRRQKITIEQISIVSRNKIEELRVLNTKYKEMILNNITSESSSLEPDLLLTDFISRSEIKISDIAQNSPVLVLRFTEYSCHACIEQSFKIINNIPHPFRKGKFIIIASYESLRDLLLFKNDKNINYPVYTIKQDSLSVPIESLNFPYFFVLDKEHKATNIFYPLVSSPELTNDYFSILIYKFPTLFRIE